jgi:6-phospho-beta-glucosidase
LIASSLIGSILLVVAASLLRSRAMGARVCIVGGGSAYMPGIAYAFAHLHERFADATLVLQDLDGEALDLQRRLTEGILRSRGAGDVRVEAQPDRLRAVEGADLVLTTFRPGGMAARHLDESIAIRHGVLGQETAGPGGFAMALRSVPIVLDIADEVRRLGNDGCILLNYTNPVQIVGEAMHVFAPDVPFVALCDQTAGEARWLAGLLHVDARSIELDTAGTNHLTFTRAVRVDGTDRTAEVWTLLDAIPLAELEDDAHRRTVRLFRELRRLPSEYLQYFAFHDDILAEQRASGRTRAQEIMAILPEVQASYRAEADRPDPHPTMARASEEHGDFAVSLMAAIRSGEPARFILNLPNAGTVDGLPEGGIVEAPARVTGSTFAPVPQGELPPGVVGLVAQVAEHARLTAAAAATGDRELAVRALAVHPLVASTERARALVADYLSAHADQLPRFAA